MLRQQSLPATTSLKKKGGAASLPYTPYTMYFREFSASRYTCDPLLEVKVTR